MNNDTTNNGEDTTTVGTDTLGEVSETVATTAVGEEAEILPSTEVEEILPMVEPEAQAEPEEQKEV
jgi:hypothetical protein